MHGLNKKKMKRKENLKKKMMSFATDTNNNEILDLILNAHKACTENDYKIQAKLSSAVSRLEQMVDKVN